MPSLWDENQPNPITKYFKLLQKMRNILVNF